MHWCPLPKRAFALANLAVPRLRMLAGPNGSGKSFLVDSLSKEVNLGSFVNADVIEAKLKAQAASPTQLLNLAEWQLYSYAG